jgi:hypothetical protein
MNPRRTLDWVIEDDNVLAVGKLLQYTARRCSHFRICTHPIALDYFTGRPEECSFGLELPIVEDYGEWL